MQNQGDEILPSTNFCSEDTGGTKKRKKKKKGYGNLKVKKNLKRRDRNITVRRMTQERGQAGKEAAEDSVETPWWEMGGTPHK